MSRSDDYFNEMQQAHLTDEAVEQLLTRTGEPGLDSDLEAFIAAFAVDTAPPRDPEHMATALAATARGARSASPRRMIRRLAVLASAGAILIAMTGVAAAADGAAPGDVLYGLDRTLEQFGIGDGGVDERITEFDQLMAVGEDTEAIEMLTEVIDSSVESVSAKAQRHLDLAIEKTNPKAADVQNDVAEKRDFIDENRGNDNGVDGSQFGKDVSEKARPDQVQENQGQGQNQGQDKNQKQEQGEPGPPDDVGQGSTNSQNRPDNAGSKKDK